MKIRLPLRPALFRTYATRLPEKPPYRAPDPLVNNPNALYQSLPGDLTFIHRPPPSAPSPLSYTTSPASPLLQQSSAPQDTPVPPALRDEKGQPPRVSDEDLAKIRQLRAEDPFTWTRARLAKEFKCTPGFIWRVAAMKLRDRKKVLAQRDEEHEKFRSRWGERKRLVREIAKKRREFW
ncbi:hypothetical protein AcW1_007838 [Taiwanofungus camphoratus]|nr:hypothetical protein AcW2_007104 [Antrodia cinnamomea]KAI0923239.1 hypothetical protein AcV7_005810 [Antrodia cinnamomea]KAI0926730.1 hypothetical protein AcV5_007440 [Antrodia cinnamomea]KAI0953678.1 hypothetical protein AcW1_007838 [Antrodia cinnamomea]